MNRLFYVDFAHRLLGVEAKEAGKEIHIALRQEAIFGDATFNARARNTILESHRDLCIRIRINFSLWAGTTAEIRSVKDKPFYC